MRASYWQRRLASALLLAFPTVALGRDGDEITLDEAMDAARLSPSMAAAEASVGEERGELRSARRLIAENPYVVIAANPTGEETLAEFEVTQQFGVSGQRLARAAAARSDLDVARADANDVARLLELDVAVAYFEALAWEERADLADEDVVLTQELLVIAAARRDGGADAPIAYELARIRKGEAERERVVAHAERRAAAVRLTALIGLDPANPVDPVGDLLSPKAMPPVEELVASALQHRPDVTALTDEAAAARARRHLALASSVPDLTIGARYDASYGVPGWVGLVGVSVPLFDQNNGGRASARSAEDRVEAELEGLRLTVAADIRIAWERWDAARQAVAVYDSDLLAAQDEALRMLTRAYEAGKLDYSDAAIGRRERLDSRLAQIDAELGLLVADASLRAAAGIPVSTTNGGSR